MTTPRITDVREGDPWPDAVSDGLLVACADCGRHPRFDYRVTDDFWRRWAYDRPTVLCLPCLDVRCGGEVAAHLEEAHRG